MHDLRDCEGLQVEQGLQVGKLQVESSNLQPSNLQPSTQVSTFNTVRSPQP